MCSARVEWDLSDSSGQSPCDKSCHSNTCVGCRSVVAAQAGTTARARRAVTTRTNVIIDYSAIDASRSIDPWSLSGVVARARTKRFSSFSCVQS